MTQYWIRASDPAPPAMPVNGDFWYDTDRTPVNERLQQWSRDRWIPKGVSSFTYSNTEPTTPANGDFWFSLDEGVLYEWNGNVWDVVRYPKWDETTVEPVNPSYGDHWYQPSSRDSALFFYNGSEWVDAIETQRGRDVLRLKSIMRLEIPIVLHCIHVAIADWNWQIAEKSSGRLGLLPEDNQRDAIAAFFNIGDIRIKRMLEAFCYMASLMEKTAAEYHQAFQLGNFSNEGRLEAIKEGMECLEYQLKRGQYRLRVQ